MDEENRISSNNVDKFIKRLFNLHSGLDLVEVRVGNSKPGSMQPFPRKPATLYDRFGGEALIEKVDWEGWKTFPFDA